MAGTVDDNTIPADWPLASDELTFVTKFTGSEERAKVLLLDGVTDDHIRWRCQSVTVDEKRDFQANPPIETPPAAAYRFFWHRYDDSRVEFDWQTSCVRRVGPVVRLGFDGVGNVWPIPDTRATSTWTANLVRFHHGDVVTRLVALGLMRPPASPFSPSQEPTTAITQLVEAAPAAPPSPPSGPESASVTPTEELEDKTTSPLEPSFPTLQMLRLKGKQQQAIWKVMSKLYSKGIPEEVRAKDLRRKVEASQKAEAKATGNKEPPKHPSPDSYERFLRAYREWYPRQHLPGN
jgi:hypothetical protein